MYILCAGLDARTIQFITRGGGTPAEAEEIETPEDLLLWCTEEIESIAVDLDSTALGLYLPRALRRAGIVIPIVGITAPMRDGETPWPEQRALFLEQGGDDLIVGPANPRELLATLSAAMRRAQGRITDIMTVNVAGVEVKADLARHVVSVNGERVHLTKQESRVFECLMRRPGAVSSKEAILTSLYPNPSDEAEMKIVDVFVCKIRRKLDETSAVAGLGTILIKTVWGRGYSISPEYTSTLTSAA